MTSTKKIYCYILTLYILIMTITALNHTSKVRSLSSTLYRTVRNMANIYRPSFIAEFCSVSEFSSVEKAIQCCDFLRTVLDKHAPPSLRKAINHNSPWFESILDDLLRAKRERRQAGRKWRNTKLTISMDLYRQAKHNV